jgi:hypothetical protein
LEVGSWRDESIFEEGGFGEGSGGNGDAEEIEEDDDAVSAEEAVLYMPSSFGRRQCDRHGWHSIANQERELRIGEINECLERLRLGLGHKSLLFRNSVRTATGQKGKTRAWGEVTRVDEGIRREVALYHQARQALVRLGAEEGLLNRYQLIGPEDLKMNGDMVEENRIGQRNDTLAWFWRLGDAGRNGDDIVMNEGECWISQGKVTKTELLCSL